MPDGRTLDTLSDAAIYITTLAKAEHDAPEWQAAMEALILVAESGRACDVHPDWRHAGAQPTPAVEASAASQARKSL